MTKRKKAKVHSNQFLRAIHTLQHYWFQIAHIPLGSRT